MENGNPFRLHCFPESGNSYKVALMLTQCGASWEPVFVDYFAGTSRTPEWRRDVNAQGELPVLDHAGLRLTQSAVILSYLAERFGKFGSADPAESREMMRWLFFDNHKFTSYLATYRFLRSFTPDPDPAVLSFLRARIDACFAVVEKHLAAHAFMVGERPTIVDFSMVGYLYYPQSETAYDLPTSHPAIAQWLKRVAALPGWRAPYEMLPGKRFASATA